jgi:putative intracellular protease/amidase
MCYNRRICAFCQIDVNEDPIVADSISPSDYRVELLKPYNHDPHYRLYYSSPRILTQLHSFFKFSCKQCTFTCNTARQFSGHARGAHHLRTCDICQHQGHSLPSDAAVYTEPQFKAHQKQHPQCTLCPFRAFDAAVLAGHMHELHSRCDICAARGTILWFATIELLQSHLRQAHFVCDICAGPLAVVFPSQLELQLHRATAHGEVAPILLDFERPAEEPDWAAERAARANNAKKRLRQSIRQAFSGRQQHEREVFAAIDALEKSRCNAPTFLARVERALGPNLDALFCDVAAAIRVPNLRAEVVRAKTGFLAGSAAPVEPPVREPPAEAPPPPPPKTPRRGRGKKIVLFSS